MGLGNQSELRDLKLENEVFAEVNKNLPELAGKNPSVPKLAVDGCQ